VTARSVLPEGYEFTWGFNVGHTHREEILIWRPDDRKTLEVVFELPEGTRSWKAQAVAAILNADDR
jgi:hypothetical protein